MVRRHLRGLAAAAPVLSMLVAAPLGAATLRTADGGRVIVERGRVADPGLVATGGGRPSAELHYEVTDGRSRTTFVGVVPGGLGGELEASLAQDPVTGAVVMVYAAENARGSNLVVQQWTGQGWSQPAWITRDGAGNAGPSLYFDDDGEAIVAWRDADRAVLLAHVRLSAAGVERIHSMSDLGHPALFAAEGDVALRAGVGHVAVDGEAQRAFVFLADPLANAVSVADVDLGQLGDIWGGTAAPVPVTFTRADAPTPSSSSGEDGTWQERHASGRLVAPYRAELLGFEIYYWLDADRLRVQTFRAGAPLALLVLERPPTEAEAHVNAYLAARHQIIRSIAGASRDRDSRDRR